MTDVERAILQAVADGRLTPEEAAAKLAEARGEGGAAAEPGGAEVPPPGHPSPGPGGAGEAPLRVLRVRAAARPVRVVADATVAEVSVEGHHELHREGEVLTVSAHRCGDEGPGGFSFVGPQLGRLARRAWREQERMWREQQRAWRHGERPGPPPWEQHGPWDWHHQHDWPDWREWQRLVEPLVVRANPDLEIELDMSAGAATVSGLRRRVVVEVSAGSLTLEDVTGPLDLRAQAAAVRVRGRLSEGASRVRCDAGTVSIVLEPGSDVRVKASCELGRVRLSNEAGDWRGTGVGTREMVVGSGRATLDVEATMGAVDVRAELARETV
jgi:hypothetical protein